MNFFIFRLERLYRSLFARSCFLKALQITFCQKLFLKKSGQCLLYESALVC